MSATIFIPDGRFERTLDSLKRHYGATSKAAIIRKAVALLSIISENEDDNGAIILKRDGYDVKIIIGRAVYYD